MENNGESSIRTPALVQLPGQLSKIPDISRLAVHNCLFVPRKLEIFPNCGKQAYFPSCTGFEPFVPVLLVERFHGAKAL
jgi:hypothetical protein